MTPPGRECRSEEDDESVEVEAKQVTLLSFRGVVGKNSPDLMGTAAARRREAPWALPRITARWEATPTEEEREKADIGIGCVAWEE